MSTELRDANMQHDCIDARVPTAYAGNRAFSTNADWTRWSGKRDCSWWIKVAKVKVIVDAEEVEREENFSLESKVRRTESLIPDSLGVVWLEWKISSLPLSLSRAFVPIVPSLSRFSVSRRSEERRSFAEPLPIKFDGKVWLRVI